VGGWNQLTEELEVLEAVTRWLDEAGIPYMLTGPLALSFYAVPRMTRDIDLVVELSLSDAGRLCDLFEGDFYVDRDAVREAVEHHGAFSIIHMPLVVKVYLVIRKDTDYRRAEFAQRRRVTLDGHPLSIVAPEDLVISKLDQARDSRSKVQLADARNVLGAQPHLDRPYLEGWISALGLEALYREVTR
jgi:hypothetical protein